jgi:glycosyltransferase involved in cell wall biosynthesis
LSDREMLVLYLGRIHKEKGLDLLVETFARVIREMEDVTLAIIGPDDGFLDKLSDHVRSLGIARKVLITGPIYGSARLEAFCDADVFVTPSYTGFPKTFVESCACGVPIVTTERGDNLGWIEGNVGYVVRYDSEHLARAILHLLRDPEERSQFSKKGTQLARERFNWNLIIDRIEDIYRGVYCRNRTL